MPLVAVDVGLYDIAPSSCKLLHLPARPAKDDPHGHHWMSDRFAQTYMEAEEKHYRCAMPVRGSNGGLFMGQRMDFVILSATSDFETNNAFHHATPGTMCITHLCHDPWCFTKEHMHVESTENCDKRDKCRAKRSCVCGQTPSCVFLAEPCTKIQEHIDKPETFTPHSKTCGCKGH